MSLLTVALPILEVVANLMSEHKDDLAKKTGLSTETVTKVSSAVTDYLSQDERAVQAMMAEIDKARDSDAALNALDLPRFVNVLRGMVRPVITLTAFFWYVYARATGVELGGEDYAIVGGVMAFWFGFRPFEKVAVPSVPPKRGS